MAKKDIRQISHGEKLLPYHILLLPRNLPRGLKIDSQDDVVRLLSLGNILDCGDMEWHGIAVDWQNHSLPLLIHVNLICVSLKYTARTYMTTDSPFLYSSWQLFLPSIALIPLNSLVLSTLVFPCSICPFLQPICVPFAMQSRLIRFDLFRSGLFHLLPLPSSSFTGQNSAADCAGPRLGW